MTKIVGQPDLSGMLVAGSADPATSTQIGAPTTGVSAGPVSKVIEPTRAARQRYLGVRSTQFDALRHLNFQWGTQLARADGDLALFFNATWRANSLLVLARMNGIGTQMSVGVIDVPTGYEELDWTCRRVGFGAVVIAQAGMVAVNEPTVAHLQAGIDAALDAPAIVNRMTNQMLAARRQDGGTDAYAEILSLEPDRGAPSTFQ